RQSGVLRQAASGRCPPLRRAASTNHIAFSRENGDYGTACALRFVRHTGLLRTDLSAAVPGVAGWRLTHLPKALSIGQVEQLLASCDRRTPAGRRDYAILMLLARLGLRGGEVSALTPGDID